MLDRTSAPPQAPLAAIRIPEARVISLSDGMTLTVVRAGDQPLARFTAIWDGGQADLPSEALTVLSDVLTEGAGPYSAEALADAVDLAGARINTRVSDHYTGISLLGLADRLPALYPVLREVATAPLLEERSVEVSRTRRATSAAIRLAKVSALAADASKAAIAGEGHPYAHVETPEGFAGVTAEEVRAVYNAIFGRGRRGLHAFLTGAVTNRLLDATVRLLESLPAGESRPSPIVIRPFAPGGEDRAQGPRAFQPSARGGSNGPAHQPGLPPRAGKPSPLVSPPLRHIDVANAVQSAVSMSIPAIGRDHPDYDMLRLTVMALGGYFGSRLMSVVREREGLTYGISANLMGLREGAYVQIDAQCSRENVEAVIAGTLRQIRELWECPLETDETERLRLHAWSTLAATADSPLSAGDYYQTQLLVGTPSDYFARQLRAIAALTPESVAATARTYLDRMPVIVTAGA